MFVFLTSDACPLEFHHILRQSSRLVRKDVFDLAEFLKEGKQLPSSLD